MKVHYPKLYNMAHFLSLNVLLLPKDLTITFIHFSAWNLRKILSNITKEIFIDPFAK